MKKKSFMLILITILTTFCLVGCKAGKEIEKNEKKEKSFEISLYENGSTGYNWSYNVDKEGIVEISSNYDNSGCDQDSDGCGGQRIYTIKALKSGKTTLTLKYSRFNDSDNPDKTAIYEITVDKDLNITETHHGSYFDEE